MTEQAPVPDGASLEDIQRRLTEALKKRLARREARCREAVQSLYRHSSLPGEEPGQPLLDEELFTEQGWELFGLSRRSLLISGVMAGGLAGGGLDLLLGGASLALGAGIGALLGGAGAWLGGGELAKVKVLGGTLGGRVVRVGPVKAANFPWVLLGRAWLHHQLVAERNHARRDAIGLAVRSERNLMDALPEALFRELSRTLGRAGRGGGDAALREALTRQVERLLAQPLAGMGETAPA